MSFEKNKQRSSLLNCLRDKDMNSVSGIDSLFQIDACLYPSDPPTLKETLRLIKSGLLYGNQVRVLSLEAHLVHTLILQEDINPAEVVKIGVEYAVAAGLPVEGADAIDHRLRKYSRLERKRYKRRNEARKYLQLKQEIADVAKEMGDLAVGIFGHDDVQEYLQAVKTGMVEVRPLKASLVNDEEAVKEFVATIGTVLSRAEKSVPLFDGGTSRLVANGLKAGEIVAGSGKLDSSKHIALAHNLFERLPVLEAAAVDEIIDVRNELQSPLIRFRSAMLAYADQIKSLPWDDDFLYEADKLFNQQVRPSILDIEELLETRPGLREFVQDLLSMKELEARAIPLGVLMFMTTMLPVSELWTTVCATALGVGAPIADTLLNLKKHREERTTTAQGSGMFFYREIQRRF